MQEVKTLQGPPVGLDDRVYIDRARAADRLECSRRPDRVSMAGMLLDNVSMQQTISRIEALIARREPAYLATPNVDHVVRIQSDPAFRQAYLDADLVVADGMPLLWAARFLGRPLREKVSGSDLFPIFCRTAAEKGYRLFFLGGRPGAAEKCAALLMQRHPGLRIVGIHCPPMGFEKDEARNQAVIEMVRASNADLLFVGLGTPKQEVWIHQYHRQCGVPVSIGIGASFDFVAGYVKRAPLVFQRMGLEWLWRLALEPGRMYRRYLVDDMAFFGLVWQQHRADRRGRTRRGAVPAPAAS